VDIFPDAAIVVHGAVHVECSEFPGDVLLVLQRPVLDMSVLRTG
jgi:hypothetical protein